MKRPLLSGWQNLLERYLVPRRASKVGFVLYRYRFLLTYILIGVISLWIEIIIWRGLERLGLAIAITYGFGFAAGVFFAYWCNVRLCIAGIEVGHFGGEIM